MLTITIDVVNDDDGDDDNYNGNGGEVMMEILWVFVAMRTRSKIGCNNVKEKVKGDHDEYSENGDAFHCIEMTVRDMQ